MARCDSYTHGQCTWGACAMSLWIPEGLGNANQWLARAFARGMRVSDKVELGAIAVFNDSGVYNATAGHVGVVIAVASEDRFQVREMNYARANVIDERWCNRAGLLGFIPMPAGVAPPAGAVTPPPLPAPVSLEAAWGDLASLWNYVVDAEVVGLQRIAQAIEGVH